METTTEIYINPRYDIAKKYDVTVVVCTYNSKLDSLIFTLNSIILQKHVKCDIVIADDCSKINFFDEIKSFFSKNSFYNWKMISNKKNLGTVKNFFSGVKISTAQYVKAISPGDAFINNLVLTRWIDYQKNSNLRWSFCDAIYYKREHDKFKCIKSFSYPNCIKPYLKKNYSQCRWNYVVLNDIALGATIICERELALNYLNMICDKVKYAEDNIYRLMMFDGIVGGYFPCDCIFYEFGLGISTSNNEFWKKKIDEDWREANSIMFTVSPFLSEEQIRMMYYSNIMMRGSRLKKLFVKGKLSYFLKSKIFPRKTSLLKGYGVLTLHTYD